MLKLFSLTHSAQHAIISLLLLLLFSPGIPSVRAQPGTGGSGTGPGTQGGLGYPANFSPSMAIIIAVLVTALFFMGFFSIYIRRCSDTAGGSVRPILSMRSRRAAAGARGLDLSVIETFPTFAYSTVKGQKIGKGALECAVCLNEFEDNETLRLIPKCDHVFHPECIDAWLGSHVTCPVCRANLVPQAGESFHLPHFPHTEFENDNQTTELDNQQNGDISIRVSDDYDVSNVQEPPPESMNRNSSSRQNRPPRSRSVRPRFFERFRSHSTGHSLVQPGENMDRFTLRLPEEVRKQVMNRAFLNRTASSLVVLPREGSSRRGYRTGEGSSKGRSFRRLEVLDRGIFSKAPSFLSRALSLRSPKVVAGGNDGSTTSSQKGVMAAVKIPSNRPQTKGAETGPVLTDSARPPV